MKTNYHQARKYRQLKYAVKQLKNSNNSNASIAKLLVLKVKRLINHLKRAIPSYKLKRLVAPALFMLGTAIQNPVEAQQFAEPIRNPFGIVTSNPILIASALVDLDGDGDLDLFKTGLAYTYASDFYYQENIGTAAEPVFDRLQANPFSLVGAFSSLYPSFGDVDADGDLDLITSSYYGIAFYENTGTAQKPEFDKAKINPFNIESSDVEVLIISELTDLDGDGDLDILSYNNEEGEYLYYQNKGNSSSPDFDLPQLNPFGLNSNENIVFLRMVDMDNDADFDLVTGTTFVDYSVYSVEGKLLYFENLGNNSSPNFQFQDTIFITNDRLERFAIPTFGDLDTDGDFDLVVNQFLEPALYYENEGNAEEFLFNNGSESAFGINDFQSNFIVDVHSYSAPEFVDLDADGDFDLVYGGVNNLYGYNGFGGVDTVYGRLKFYENVGTLTKPEFELPVSSPFENINTYFSAVPAFNDIDSDGDFDLFVTEYYGKVTFFENTGSAQNPVFENSLENPFGLVLEDSYLSKLLFADMDNDGDEDCFYSTYDNLVYFENISYNGQFNFQRVEDFANINVPFQDDDYLFFDLVDFDNDGDHDIFSFVAEYNKLFYYQNIGTPQNASFAEIDSIDISKYVSEYYEYDYSSYLMFPDFADIDGDGDPDIIFGSQSYFGNLYYYENIDSIPVNIPEIEQLHVSIFPNPTNNILNLSSFKTIDKVEILNVTGQIVKQYNNAASIISLKELPAATYLIKITDVNGVQAVKKLYKQ